MLRDRLQSMGSDLIDARSRVTELEASQFLDREALRKSTNELSDAGMSGLRAFTIFRVDCRL